VRLVDYDPNAEDKIIAALAYPQAAGDYEHLLAWVRGLRPEEKEKLLQSAVGSPRSFDAGPRALETTSYTFEITIDYGAWRDIQRHRICTQLAQDFSPDLGYVEPEEFAELGLTDRYRRARELATRTYHQIHRQFPADAVYVLPLGHRVRTIFTMNLREAFHFARLRSSPHGHISYRRVAVALWDQIKKAHPLLARYLSGVHAIAED
jgi:thymidylate synthase ThyX